MTSIQEYNDLIFAIQGTILMLVLLVSLFAGIIYLYLYVWKNRKTNGFSNDYVIEHTYNWLQENKHQLNRIEHNTENLKNEFAELKKDINDEKN
mgnify:CR=1 FL=1